MKKIIWSVKWNTSIEQLVRNNSNNIVREKLDVRKKWKTKQPIINCTKNYPRHLHITCPRIEYQGRLFRIGGKVVKSQQTQVYNYVRQTWEQEQGKKYSYLEIIIYIF